MATEKIKGAEAIIRSLLAEGVDTLFGYPGGQVIPVFDALYDYREKLRHILVRHEQGATHAAQGYARVSGKVGVVIVTSGPGATNTITGIADAMMDSTPMVVITGQVPSALLGADAFQETDVMGITQPLTKWSYQVRCAKDIPEAMARAFYIAQTGRPGPVVLDITKDAQVEWMEFAYEKCNYVRSYNPSPTLSNEEIATAAHLINAAQKPLLLVGQGVILSGAEKELLELAEKADIPLGSTLLGLSAVPTHHPLNMGMIGMHGSIAPNIKTNECDLLIAIGMRFDDRVTGDVEKYAPQAKVLHFDIDQSEFNKNIKTYATVWGDARESLTALLPQIKPAKHTRWIESFADCKAVEEEKVVAPELDRNSGPLTMGEVVRKVSKASHDNAILVTDVGQNQMFGARYFGFTQSRSMVTSGGLGTMGFGLPAAIGAKVGAPDRTVCFFCGDGGIQMTVQELGTILQEQTGVKIIILNNNYLGMVRQWQQLFFHERYSQTLMHNPDFALLAQAYGIAARTVTTREELSLSIAEMFSNDQPYLLNACVEESGMVFPMVPAGAGITDILLNATEKYIF